MRIYTTKWNENELWNYISYRRYKRIKDISEMANQKIEDFLNWNTKKYSYFDFNF